LEVADEVFITSTTRDLLPVAEIEGRKTGTASRAVKALSAAFGAYLDNYVAQHKAAHKPQPV
jgi:branched-subunit amino acid aminotransferase/4-amino-4-deoxychorismate lyase